MRAFVALCLLVGSVRSANAEDDLANWLIGPVLGIRVGGTTNNRLVIGIEGGVGYGPERINLGFEHRSDHDVGYIELDPWYIVGGSLGVAVNDEGEADPVLGLWEGVPLSDTGNCTDWHDQLTIAGGYRYIGVHELYVTIKAGRMHGNICFH